MNNDEWNKDDIANEEYKERHRLTAMKEWEEVKNKINEDKSKLVPFREKVQLIADEIVDLLCEKNKKYGNSALEPKRIFSKIDAVEQLKVRIDDKLSRLSNMGIITKDEDTVMDLIGYLFLLKIATT